MQLGKNAGSSVVPMKKKVFQYFYLNHPCYTESKEKTNECGRVVSTEVNIKLFDFVRNNSRVTIPNFLTF